MKTTQSLTALALAAAALLATSLDARAQGRGSSPGVPPGHLPPAGMCRVWYDGRPPGHQPPPTDCRNAEAVASRDRDARVIYGGGTRGGSWDRDNRWDTGGAWEQPGEWGRRGTPDGYSAGRAGAYGGYHRVGRAYDIGYRDGLEEGRQDRHGRDRFNPARHRRYRSADHGYSKRYGPKDAYRDVYRQGFVAGYDAAFRAGHGYRRSW